MNVKNLLAVAFFAAICAFYAPAFAQAPKEEIPLAEAIPAGETPPDGETRVPPPPPPTDEGEEAPQTMPTGNIAGAYEPTAVERNFKISAHSVKLAENGRALVPIIVSSRATRATRATRDAVGELAEYLNRITGATFEVQTPDGKPYDTKNPVGPRNSKGVINHNKALAIMFAENAAKPADPLPASGLILGSADEWELPGEWKEGLAMRGAFHGKEAYAIRTNAKRVALIGAFKGGVNHVTYRFLHEIGCRWFAPSDHWEIVPTKPNLSFGIDLTDRPSIGTRVIAFMDGVANEKERTDQRVWGRRNLIGGSFGSNTGHAWSLVIQRNGATLIEHPEYFAMLGGKRFEAVVTGKDGKKTIPYPNAVWAKLDVGNPAVRQMFVDYALSYFRAKPDSDMVSLSPNDGGGFSQSPESRALGDGSISDAVYTMVNEVARAVKKEFPGKMVGCYAYRETAAPPSFPLEDNVYIEVATLLT